MPTDARLAGTIATSGEQDDGIRVSLEDDQPAQPGQEPPPVTANLLPLFQPTEVNRTAKLCLEEFDEAVKSREQHMRTLRRIYELYANLTKIKNWPFQSAANVNIPIEAYTLLQIHGRLVDNLIPDKGDVLNTIATRVSDPDDVDIATRTSLFVNWYLREKVTDFRASYDATLWQLVAFGSTFRESYWDYLTNRLCVEWIGIEDMVVPYAHKTTDPYMRGVPHYTRIRHLSLFEIQDRARNGEFDEDVVKTLKKGDTASRSHENSEFKEIVDQVDGTEESTTQQFLEDEPRDVYRQYRWLRLPNRPDAHPAFDGLPHPVKIEIDKSSEKILSIMLREEDDPDDARRFAREQGAFQSAQQANDQHQQMQGVDAMGQPLPPPPPVPPEPKPVRQREVCFTTHWMAFQSEGFYGLGLGHFIMPINEAMNTLFNQQLDRSTVNNAGGGIISRQVKFQRGPINKQPGLYVEVDAPASAVKDGLQSWPMVPPDPDGRWFLQYLEQMSGRVSGAGDTLSGEPVGSNETARAAMARFEQATKQISILGSRCITYLTHDIQIWWRLFGVHLDEQEYVDVCTSRNRPLQIKIGRDDFKADAKVIPTADARMGSRAQRTSEAQDLFTFVTAPTSPPELTQNPAVRRAAIEIVLRAMDAHELIDLLGPPPGPPQPPPPQPQWAENASFLQDHDAPVNPADDDDAHLLEMQNFKQDPLGYEKLSPTARKMFDNHERGHLAQ